MTPSMASDEPDIEMAVIPRTLNYDTSQTELQLMKTFSTQERREQSQNNDTSSTSQSFTIIKTTSKSGKQKTTTRSQPKLSNNLLISAGFLDLASACDFAANIWNQYPVPPYASALMIIGGLFALSMSLFAIKDFHLSYPNYTLIRSERLYLKQLRTKNIKEGIPTGDLDSCLEVNFRELGNEVARLGMDLVMGFGVFLVGIGTIMAFWGSNRKVFHASNLLSGYVGNAPIAFFGLANSAWSIYLWRKTYEHSRAGRKFLKGRKVGKLLERRTRVLRLYSTLYGVSGFFTGVGSLISATEWFGYVVSAPWVVTSVFCNWLFRHRIGYDRGSIHPTFFATEALIRDIEVMSEWKRKFLVLSAADGTKLRDVVLHSMSLVDTLEFLVQYDLYDDFCRALVGDKNLFRELFGQGEYGEFTIHSESLGAVEERFHGRLLGLAGGVVDKYGLRRFRQRKRFLLEALGCFLCAGEKLEERENSVGERENKAMGRESG